MFPPDVCTIPGTITSFLWGMITGPLDPGYSVGNLLAIHVARNAGLCHLQCSILPSTILLDALSWLMSQNSFFNIRKVCDSNSSYIWIGMSTCPLMFNSDPPIPNILMGVFVLASCCLNLSSYSRLLMNERCEPVSTRNVNTCEVVPTDKRTTISMNWSVFPFRLFLTRISSLLPFWRHLRFADCVFTSSLSSLFSSPWRSFSLEDDLDVSLPLLRRSSLHEYDLEVDLDDLQTSSLSSFFRLWRSSSFPL